MFGSATRFDPSPTWGPRGVVPVEVVTLRLSSCLLEEELVTNLLRLKLRYRDLSALDKWSLPNLQSKYDSQVQVIINFAPRRSIRIK